MSDLDLCWVHDKLALGGSFPARAIPQLAHSAILHVIDARDETRDDVSLLLAHGIGFLHVPTPDQRPLDAGTLQVAVNWAFVRICQGDGVLVHCEYGIGRSVVIAVPLLVRCLGVRPVDAMRRIKAMRPNISPSPAQLESVMQWCEHENLRAPSWDELARIAYSAPPAQRRLELRAERGSLL